MIAYAMKHLKMSLKEAFGKLQKVRTYARPSLSFFVQLIQYEFDCQGCNSVQMVKEPMSFEMDKRKTSSEKKKMKKKKQFIQEQYILVPDFYRHNYPHLLKIEIANAKSKGNNPFVSTIKNISSKTSLNNSHQKMNSVNSKQRVRSNSKISKIKKSNKLLVSCQNQVTNTQCQSQILYPNNELKPFVVEDISYEHFLAELEKVRNNPQIRIESLSSASTSILKVNKSL